MKEFYTYLHRDSNGRVFYVGCATANPDKRGVRAKLGRAYSTYGHTAEWDAIATCGYTVEILDKHQSKQDAYKQEIALIAKFREAGEPLVNISAGGGGSNGIKDSPEVRKKKSITKLGELNPMHGRFGLSHPNSRMVIQSGYGYVFASVQEAAEFFGVKMKTLYNQLSGHRPNKFNLEFA